MFQLTTIEKKKREEKMKWKIKTLNLKNSGKVFCPNILYILAVKKQI